MEKHMALGNRFAPELTEESVREAFLRKTEGYTEENIFQVEKKSAVFIVTTNDGKRWQIYGDHNIARYS